jgi:hypothetical protein
MWNLIEMLRTTEYVVRHHWRLLSAYLILLVGSGIYLLLGNPFWENWRPNTSPVLAGWILISMGVGVISLIWGAIHLDRMSKMRSGRESE